MDDLRQSREHIDDILSNTLTLLDSLSHLAKEFNAVESQTSNFGKQCEGLLAAQERDTKLANGIQTNLHYYEFLDPASRRLNAPGAGNTVRDEEFTDMLRRLDVCLDYMETHVSFIHIWNLIGRYIDAVTARAKRGRSLPVPIPAALDPRPHADPRQFRIVSSRHLSKCLEKAIRSVTK